MLRFTLVGARASAAGVGRIPQLLQQRSFPGHKKPDLRGTVRSKSTFTQTKGQASKNITAGVIAACAFVCVSTAVYRGHNRSLQLHALDPRVSTPRKIAGDGY